MNGIYSIDEKQSSVGVYKNKKGKNEEHNNKIEEVSRMLEDKLQATLQNAVECHSRLFLHCSNYLSPVMDVAYQMQDGHGDINLTSGKMSEIGQYSAQVCINATTRDYHTEFDQGPTLIYVPNQTFDDQNKYNFCFRINNKRVIKLKMIPNLSFVFSAAMLNHRQECEETGNNLFINLASFCNKKLFCHMKR